jgi:hypothetical protein
MEYFETELRGPSHFFSPCVDPARWDVCCCRKYPEQDSCQAQVEIRYSRGHVEGFITLLLVFGMPLAFLYPTTKGFYVYELVIKMRH